jgi:heterodisulfide reductase subunit C2
MTTVVDPGFADRVREAGAFDAEACMNCGVCTAICPLGVDLLPRRLFRYVLLGMEGRVLAETESVYSCLLCRACEESCPAGVHITENVRTLRHYVNRRVFGL